MIVSRISNLPSRFLAADLVTDMFEAFDAVGVLWLRSVRPLEDQA
jgi:hypothetical protein